MPGTGRRSAALLLLGAASLLSSWNPASAPMGLLVGLATVALCLYDLRLSGTLSRPRRAALVIAAAGLIASAAVLVLLSGAGRRPDGHSIVEEAPSEAREERLEREAKRTKEAREAARRELEQLGPGRRGP